ncbi:Major facilitator superfamily (MFS) transporter [Oceanicola granulosus HTCC2516]|uniref:Major facilitator superfamily (MFS) transporter n=1 Tax=Oceanicola granulosus (strain ATCC BAA-861 / DSM 15982 / KCTC 12143 / HTCC2516) TaxID=314256 RepID=Q2CJV4_OCEGH|nr:Major facilitator superfamily (MFS) transporter [Oceanicola granulosus HTCC2516]
MFKFVRENAAFLLAGMLVAFTSSYGQTFFISIFAGEIRAEFGLSHGRWGLIYTLGTTLSAVTMIWAGMLTDLFRVRQLGLVIFPILALACLSMATVPGAVLLIFVIYLLRLMGQGMMSHLAAVAMARWFVRRRGTALSISSMGFALGQAILPIIFVALLAVWDWRTLWLVAAGLVLLALPVVHRLLRLERTPQAIAKESEASGMDGRHWRRSEVLRHPLFWLMVPALMGPPTWGTALFFQQVHLAEVKGWSLAAWVSLMPLFTVTLIAANFASGLAVDRFGTTRMARLFMLPFALAFLVLGLSGSLWSAALGLMIFATGQGMQATVPPAFWAEYFGTRHLGSIKAVASAIMVFGSAVGPGVSGVLIDAGYDFDRQMLFIVGYFLFAAALAWIGLGRARSALPAAA